MQCCINGVLIPKFLAPISSESTYSVQFENTFDATHPIIVPLKSNRVTSYFKVKTPTQEEYEDQNILKIRLTADVSSWYPSSAESSRQEQSMFNYRVRFVSPNTPASWQLFINSVTLYAYDAADVIDEDNYASVLESGVSTLSLQVACVNTEKVSGLNHLFLPIKWGVSPKKALNKIRHTKQHGVHTVLHLSLCREFKTNNRQL